MKSGANFKILLRRNIFKAALTLLRSLIKRVNFKTPVAQYYVSSTNRKFQGGGHRPHWPPLWSRRCTSQLQPNENRVNNFWKVCLNSFGLSMFSNSFDSQRGLHQTTFSFHRVFGDSAALKSNTTLIYLSECRSNLNFVYYFYQPTCPAYVDGW